MEQNTELLRQIAEHLQHLNDRVGILTVQMGALEEILLEIRGDGDQCAVSDVYDKLEEMQFTR